LWYKTAAATVSIRQFHHYSEVPEVSYKILLADDSVTVQKIITLTFSDEGVDVMTVSNGDEAINKLQYSRPALVMADVSIPGKNGYDICEFVKNHPDMKDTPVILLVPAFEPFDEERARRVGADQHLTKPFQSIRTLISTVKALLEPSVQRRTADLLKQAALASTLNAPRTEPAAVSSPDVTDDELEFEDGVPPADDLLTLESEQEDTATIGANGSAQDAPEIFPELAEEAATPAPASLSFAADDSDDVLDLDDVLPNIWATPPPASQFASLTESDETPAPTTAAEDAPPALTSVSSESTATIPQAVIDEIVERVTAQLTEQLTEKLSQDLARRLAPAVAELLKQPQLSRRASYQEADSLLDLDEF
jgi:CheY-like chemotaxis protein